MNVGQATKWDAGLYDDKHSFVWKMAAGLLDLLEPKAGQLILDVGCGTGHLAAQIASTGALVTGIDRSPEMVRQAQEKYPHIFIQVMDARKLAFAEKFDAVFSNATLHWIKEAEQVVGGISGVLRPGGRFVAEFGGKGNVPEFVAAAERAWHACQFAGTMPNPWYYPSIGEYAALLEAHGLEVTYAALFDRPTPLEDGERGLRNWLEMFGESIVSALSRESREKFAAEVERQARPALYRDGAWVMDYRRLRVVAIKR
jgi:trans-aconitate methyltransferase